ncbi:hypothetical protein HLB44_02045 [Aquincola sp. S2]|uniref:PEP-CTERM sorting domain-containing protein n=1 Tax=Pseudaquabacterium terrae TaxID=2732868 RepID=A0ABX2EBG7_9BURK|nr:hypothetical protein [Aquabacterium terrae]NRF65759.1 hypothetical protein [Aquabacterium terrae]
MGSIDLRLRTRHLAALCALLASLAVADAQAQAAKPLAPLPALQTPIGAPQRSTPANDPIILQLQLRDPNDATRGRIQKVNVTYVKTDRKQGEDDFAYAARLTREKAAAIADATNALVPGTAKAIDKEVNVIVGYRRNAQGRYLRDRFGFFIPIYKKFKQGYVEFTNLVNDPRLKNDPQMMGQQVVFGERVRQQNGTIKIVGGNPTGEPGGGVWGQGEIPGVPPPPPPSSGSSMGSMMGSAGTSSGISIGDFPGDPTSTPYAAFGVFEVDSFGDPITSPDGGVPVAVVDIVSGQTANDVLQSLYLLLQEMNIEATLDLAESLLFIDGLGANQQVYWNETDTGLEFGMSAAFIVPLPDSLGLALTGLMLMAGLRSTRR